MSQSPRLSHIEINVSDYGKSIRFYDSILGPLGWERLTCTTNYTAYCDGFSKLILSPVSDAFRDSGFHRKRIGLNHLAFYADSKAEVDSFYEQVLLPLKTPSLYQDGPEGDGAYYSVLFEDPDRMKLEVVYSPKYCSKDSWPNTVESNFDPYA